MNDIEKEILNLEEQLTQTERRVDVEVLDRIYADDIMMTAPIGVCVDKLAVMDEIRPKQFPISSTRVPAIRRYHRVRQAAQ